MPHRKFGMYKGICASCSRGVPTQSLLMDAMCRRSFQEGAREKNGRNAQLLIATYARRFQLLAQHDVSMSDARTDTDLPSHDAPIRRDLACLPMQSGSSSYL